MTTEASYFGRFISDRKIGITKDSLIKDRAPSAISSITMEDSNKSVGKVDFYSTPMGTVISASIYSIPCSKDEYEPLFIEIDGKRCLKESTPSYRIKTSNLPPIFIKQGNGNMSFMTDRFSADDVIGRQIRITRCGLPIASGQISRINDFFN